MPDVPADKYMVVLDADGRHRVVNLESFLAVLASRGFMIIGLSIPVISALKAEYLKRGGEEPITPKSVQETFNK